MLWVITEDKTVPEFKLIDTELSEARLYRGTRQFGTLSGKDISNLMFLNTLLIWTFSRSKRESGYAREYARQTAQYGAYPLFRTHATDLYMLCYQICHPNNDYVILKDRGTGKEYLKSLQFADKKHIGFMRKVATGQADVSEANAYLLRLDGQMKITDGRYKRWRRSCLDWRNLSMIQKSTLIYQIAQEIKRLGGSTGRHSEILVPMQTFVKVKKKINKLKGVDKQNVIKRVTGVNKAQGMKRISDYWNKRVKK